MTKPIRHGRNFKGRHNKPGQNNTVAFWRQFSLKHVFRAGAIIWVKSKGKDYYVVFKSHTRPTRGIQIPGGRVEKFENVGQTIIREVYEETGLKCTIVCPLGFYFFENTPDNYSNLQVFFLIRPNEPIDVDKSWRHIDKDASKQDLECWCEPIEKDESYLASGQDQIVRMFRKWLRDHKKPPRTREQTIEPIISN